VRWLDRVDRDVCGEERRVTIAYRAGVWQIYDEGALLRLFVSLLTLRHLPA